MNGFGKTPARLARLNGHAALADWLVTRYLLALSDPFSIVAPASSAGSEVEVRETITGYNGVLGTAPLSKRHVLCFFERHA